MPAIYERGLSSSTGGKFNVYLIQGWSSGESICLPDLDRVCFWFSAFYFSLLQELSSNFPSPIKTNTQNANTILMHMQLSQAVGSSNACYMNYIL